MADQQTTTPVWFELAKDEAWKKAQKILEHEKRTDELAKYADDPVAFGTQVLGERYTNDVKNVMRSVRDYPITIAK